MKKTIALVLALAAIPAMAGEPKAVTIPTPAPEPAPAACPLTLEVGVMSAFSTRTIYKHNDCRDIDTLGVDLTLCHALDENNSVNLRFGYSFGDECLRDGVWREETDVHTFVLMPGYRYTHAIDDTWSVYGGINLGIANMSVKETSSVDFGEDGSWRTHDHDSAYGFAYSVEVGARYKIDEQWEAFAGYMFTGSGAAPSVWAEEGTDCRCQSYHAIRAGVSYKF